MLDSRTPIHTSRANAAVHRTSRRTKTDHVSASSSRQERPGRSFRSLLDFVFSLFYPAFLFAPALPYPTSRNAPPDMIYLCFFVLVGDDDHTLSIFGLVGFPVQSDASYDRYSLHSRRRGTRSVRSSSPSTRIEWGSVDYATAHVRRLAGASRARLHSVRSDDLQAL